MDKEILQHAVQELFNPDHVLRFPDASQIHFNEVQKLSLEYKSEGKIMKVMRNVAMFSMLILLE